MGTITAEQFAAFEEYLCREERAASTVTKYLHDIGMFDKWLGGNAITKESAVKWKEFMSQSGRAAVTVNASLAALHSFFSFSNHIEFKVKYLKIQRQMFRDASRELTKEEYQKLVKTALEKGKERLALLMETICATGVRVSEVKYITIEALGKKRAEISLKGKIRTILIPNKLAKKLSKYAKKQKIVSGEIFVTAGGRSLSRRQIWGEMKKLCNVAGVDESKVFPHNLRHLFARTYYRVCRDIVKLADVLGHSSIEVTRIYLVTTGTEYAKELDGLGLIS